MADSESDPRLEVRLSQVEKDLVAVKGEFKRLNRIECELEAIKEELRAIRNEHATFKADRKDIKEQVDSVDHYLTECLELVDTTAKKLQVVEESVSDLQEKDASSIGKASSEVGSTQEATAGAHDRTSSPEGYIDFGAVFVERMDAMQGAVLKRMDAIETAVQSKLDQPPKIGGAVEDRINSVMLVNIAKKMEDFLEHSMAVVSCESKLESMEKIAKKQNARIKSMEQNMGDFVKRQDTRCDREEEKLELLEQQVVALGTTNMGVSTGPHSGKGLDKLVIMVSKLGMTMEDFDKTLRNATVSDTTLQNILQWVQSINSKIVDLGSKGDGQKGGKRGEDSLQKAISSLAMKADLQFMAATFHSTAPGKEIKKGGSVANGSDSAAGWQQFSGAKLDKTKPAAVQQPTGVNKPKLATTLVISQAGPSKPRSGAAAAQSPAEKPKLVGTPVLSSAGPSKPKTMPATVPVLSTISNKPQSATGPVSTPTILMDSDFSIDAKLNAQAKDFEMPETSRSHVPSPFENWEDVVLPDMVRKENIRATGNFADSY